jgi:hypothetical protein
MQIIRLPTGQKLAKVLISSSRYDATSVRVVMSISSAMQSMAEHAEYASTEEAERQGIAWAERHNAEVLLIEHQSN